MHPGPMNRGVEIDGAIADDPERSLITLQVEMGVAVRMACLELSSAVRLSARRYWTGASPAKLRTKQLPPWRCSDMQQRERLARRCRSRWTDRR